MASQPAAGSSFRYTNPMAAARLGVADTALSQPAVGQSPPESRARTGSASTASSFHSEDSVSGRGRVSSMARSSDVALRRLWRGSRRASATADELQSLGQDFTVAAKTFESEATAEPKTVAGKCWRWFTQKHHPTQGFRVRWDIASMLVLLFCLVEIPYRVAFEQSAELWSFADLLNLATDVFFLTECYLNFRTGVTVDGEIVYDSKTIAREYLKLWFWLDFLTSIPYSNFVQWSIAGDEQLESNTLRLTKLLRVVRIVRLLKLLRLLKLMKVMGKWTESNSHSADVIKLVKFVVLIFFMAHTCACGWMLVANLEKDPEGWYDTDSWPIRHNAPLNDPSRMYLLSAYWSLATLTTVGFGDIVASTNAELLYTCAVMFTGAVVFGWIVGNVASIITHEDATAALIRAKSNSIREYMKARKLPKHLRHRIISHYNFAWRRATVYEEDKIMEELPRCLRMDLAMFIHHDLIEQVPFLRGCDVEAKTQLVQRLRPLQVSAGDYVCHKGDTGLELYFISQGMLDVVDEELPLGEDVIVGLGPGQYFGEFALLATEDQPSRRSASVRARVNAELYSLLRDDFADLVRVFPELHEQLLKAAETKMRKTRRFKAAPSFRAAAKLLHRASSVTASLGKPARMGRSVSAKHRRRKSLRRTSAPASSPSSHDGSPPPPERRRASSHAVLVGSKSSPSRANRAGVAAKGTRLEGMAGGGVVQLAPYSTPSSEPSIQEMDGEAGGAGVAHGVGGHATPVPSEGGYSGDGSNGDSGSDSSDDGDGGSSDKQAGGPALQGELGSPTLSRVVTPPPPPPPPPPPTPPQPPVASANPLSPGVSFRITNVKGLSGTSTSSFRRFKAAVRASSLASRNSGRRGDTMDTDDGVGSSGAGACAGTDHTGSDSPPNGDETAPLHRLSGSLFRPRQTSDGHASAASGAGADAGAGGVRSELQPGPVVSQPTQGAQPATSADALASLSTAVTTLQLQQAKLQADIGTLLEAMSAAVASRAGSAPILGPPRNANASRATRSPSVGSDTRPLPGEDGSRRAK